MDRLAADHAVDRPVASRDADALADQHHGVPAADLAEAQVAVVVDVRDVDADLVDVADHGQGQAAPGAGDTRHRGADVVASYLRREALAAGTPDARGGALVTRRAGGGQQVVEQFGRWHRRKASRRAVGLARQQLAKHVLEDSAVAVVALLLGRVDPDRDLEGQGRAPALPGVGLDREPRGTSSTPAIPAIVNSSSPVRPSEETLSPSENCSGSTPIPIRLERWMRS